MSRTTRRDREDKKYAEGQKDNRKLWFSCRCSYCTGIDRKELKEKIANREMKRQLKDAVEWNHTENELLSKYKSNIGV